MGSGSFGGGSGAFGGGGSGAGGGGGRGSATERTDSSVGRIRDVESFTRALNEHPAFKDAQKVVITALRLPARKKYAAEIFGDPGVDGIYRELFALHDTLGDRFAWAKVAERYGIDRKRAALRNVVTAIGERFGTPATDERLVAIALHAVRGVFLRAVQDDYDSYTDARPSDLDAQFDMNALNSTSAFFIGGLLREVVRRDVASLSVQARATLDEVTLEIANGWIRAFEAKYRPAARYRDVLKIITANPAEFPV